MSAGCPPVFHLEGMRRSLRDFHDYGIPKDYSKSQVWSMPPTKCLHCASVQLADFDRLILLQTAAATSRCATFVSTSNNIIVDYLYSRLAFPIVASRVDLWKMTNHQVWL